MGLYKGCHRTCITAVPVVADYYEQHLEQDSYSTVQQLRLRDAGWDRCLLLGMVLII